jgi:ABC-type bacteriocin/lantibiotic exporter with double-glycine peptidase domain
VHTKSEGPSTLRELSAEEKKAEEERQKKESFKIMLAYSKQEKLLFSLGMVTLFFGELSNLAIPLFVGMVIDMLVKAEYQ